MIALQNLTAFDTACGPITWAADGTHNAPACNCSDGAGHWSKWVVNPHTTRYVGAAPTFMPYFYYQTPAAAYPGARQIGWYYSTPAATACAEGTPVGSTMGNCTARGCTPVGSAADACTWHRLPDAQLIYGTQLLAAGWDTSSPAHWPLHRFGPNTTAAVEHNQPVFDRVWDSLAQWQTPRCCGC